MPHPTAYLTHVKDVGSWQIAREGRGGRFVVIAPNGNPQAWVATEADAERIIRLTTGEGS